MFSRIAVIGLGLLGGSLCRAVRRRDPGVRLDAYGRDVARLSPALDDGTVDSAAPLDRLDLTGVDLAVVSVPVETSIEIIHNVLAHRTLGGNAVVVDVGSVKGAIVASAADAERGDRFIGCHPMAGSERTGYAASDAGLYEGASVIVTPHGRNLRSDVDRVARFWEFLGARATITDAEAHDRLVARTSHLPHCAAAAIVMSALGAGDAADFVPFAGRGFLDTTRVSSGSPDIWREICRMNRGNILPAMDDLIAELGELRALIASGEAGVEAYFEKAKKTRDGFCRVYDEKNNGRR